MKQLTAKELRESYLKFFNSKGHNIIPSASLIPENDPSVLFTTAGMHPLVPYLLGEEHPAGKRLCDVQKCVRTGDIDDIGDETHCTFFEMLGNWSLGDYFKEESIAFSFEFLTKILEIPVERLAVSVFAGDENAPRDDVSANTWRKMGLKDSQIFFLPKDNNWWWAGQTGPCGPDTEIFFNTMKEVAREEDSPAFDSGKYIEIWNNVFMEYFRDKDGNYSLLKQRNVDTGMGLERTLCILQGVKSVYETDLFKNIIEHISKAAKVDYGKDEQTTRAIRIIADHIRTVTFIIGDKNGVAPSNMDQGYVVRRLIRRAVRYANILDLSTDVLVEVSNLYIEQYSDTYSELLERKDVIKEELVNEINKFKNTLNNGLKEIDKVLQYTNGNQLNGKTAFRLYDTYGFPIEMTVEILREKGYSVDLDGFKKAQEEHRLKSQKGAEQKFKGGLADTTEKTAQLHTATHIMLAGLRKLISENINQRGSNITSERLRFDFNLDRPLTKAEISMLEEFVNDVIKKDIPVVCDEMSITKAREMGATGIFVDKYGEIVKVYQIGDVSLELCGGPHAKRTGELGHFKIEKEQSSSAGVRRIKAILE